MDAMIYYIYYQVQVLNVTFLVRPEAENGVEEMTLTKYCVLKYLKVTLHKKKYIFFMSCI